MPIIEFSSVIKKLEALDPHKSNDIPIKLIVQCANLLFTPLTAILNQYFVDGVFPSVLKQVYVTPIPKCKTLKDITDLRPI